MPLGGFCEECGRWVWLTPYGACENGHKARSVRDVRQLRPSTETGVAPPEGDYAPFPVKRATSLRLRFWWRHSLWVGWTLTGGFFGWISFFYISARTRYKPWALWGFMYLVPLILTLASWGTPLGKPFLLFQLFASAGAFLHALYLRPYYRAIMFGDTPRRNLPSPPEPPPLLNASERPVLPSGNGAEAEALQEARGVIDGIVETAARVSDQAVRAKIVALCRTGDQILAELAERPAKMGAARSFLTYYLDAAQRIVEGYTDLSERRLSTPEITQTLKRAQASLDSVQQAFERELANVLADTVLDLDSEIELLQKTVQMDDLYRQTGGL